MIPTQNPQTLLTTAEMTRLGRRIRRRRREKNLSQRDLAGEQASTGYISRIESGQRRPSPSLLRTIATRLDIPVEALLDANPAPSSLSAADNAAVTSATRCSRRQVWTIDENQRRLRRPVSEVTEPADVAKILAELGARLAWVAARVADLEVRIQSSVSGLTGPSMSAEILQDDDADGAAVVDSGSPRRTG